MPMNYTLSYFQENKKHLREVYCDSRWAFDRYFPGRNPWMYCETQSMMDWQEFKIRSRVAFCDAADLKESKSIQPLHDIVKLAGLKRWRKPECFDHTMIWYRPVIGTGSPIRKRQYLVTTEPYGPVEPTLAFCRDLGLEAYACRPGIGLWNPGVGGTRLVLISPPSHALPVAEVAEAIEAALPERRDYPLTDH